MDLKRQLKIDYTNYKGLRSTRTILPLNLWYGRSEYHHEEGWFIRAIDLGRDALRDFYLPDIHSSEPME